MAKRIGFSPLILLGDTPGDDTVIGGGTGQGGVNPPVGPMSFAEWQQSAWAEDYLGDGSFDFGDYCMWWESWGFSRELWEQMNPGESWDDWFN